MSSHSVFSIHVKNMFLQQLKRNVSKSMQRHKIHILFWSICILNVIGFIVLTVICLNNSISFIYINAECMLMLTEQNLCQWRLDLLGVVFLFFSMTRCGSLQFSAKQEIHSHLQHHKNCSCKIGGGGNRIISKLLTGEISETSINYNNSLLSFTAEYSLLQLSCSSNGRAWR